MLIFCCILYFIFLFILAKFKHFFLICLVQKNLEDRDQGHHDGLLEALEEKARNINLGNTGIDPVICLLHSFCIVWLCTICWEVLWNSVSRLHAFKYKFLKCFCIQKKSLNCMNSIFVYCSGMDSVHCKQLVSMVVLSIWILCLNCGDLQRIRMVTGQNWWYMFCAQLEVCWKSQVTKLYACYCTSEVDICNVSY